jgi:FAD binding domain/Berberine and berberine like
MKWKSAKQKEKELRVLGWQALASPAPPNQVLPFTADAVGDLELKIQGKLVRPTDPEYHAGRQLANFAFQDFPVLIAYCEVIADVRRCLQFARDKKIPVVVRSGGHSTAGFSIGSGMVIDLSRLSYVVVDAAKKQAIVGAGTKFGHLFAALDIYNLHVPGGGCHDVCVAGFMQGGGFGYTSRQFGMNCDNVVEALVLLADGGIVVASETTNPDLFWALRGGTGGNFGILLQVTYRLYSLGKLWGFRITWEMETDEDKDRAARVLAKLQQDYMRRCARNELGYMAFLTWQNDKRCLVMRGMFHGAPEDGKEVLRPLTEIKPNTMTEEHGSYLDIDKFIHEKPDIPQVDDLAREDKQSGYIERQLDPADWLKVIDVFLTTPNPWSMVGIEAYGGAINAQPKSATAFVHRDVSLDLYLDVFWMTDAERGPAVKFLGDFMDFMEKHYFTGASYQNYPRLTQTDYRRRYWGDYFEQLLTIKQKYDPKTFFSYPQGVLPEPQTQTAKEAAGKTSAAFAVSRIEYVLPPE